MKNKRRKKQKFSSSKVNKLSLFERCAIETHSMLVDAVRNNLMTPQSAAKLAINHSQALMDELYKLNDIKKN